MVVQECIRCETRGRGSIALLTELQRIVAASGICTGLCNVFLEHTSASLILSENADPDVRDDLERFMARLVPDGDPLFRHTAEGPDDMPAHIRSVLTTNSIVLPIRAGQCHTGTWQGLYLWEHRTGGERMRNITVTLYGE